MNYPTIEQYKEALRNPVQNLNVHCDLCAVEDIYGSMTMYISEKSVVFKMTDRNTGRMYALKCFLYEDKCRDERYRKFTRALSADNSEYILNTRFIEDGIKTDDIGTYPVVLTDWVEGIRLDKFIDMYVGNTYPMRIITANLCSLAVWLRAHNVIHCDIAADNIILRDDLSIVLIDYDAMTVRTSAAEKSSDDLRMVQLLLSLKALTLSRTLYEHYSTGRYLLFDEADCQSPFNSAVLREIQSLNGDEELQQLLGLFYIVMAKGSLEGVSPQLLCIEKPEIVSMPWLEYVLEGEDDEYGIGDDCGGVYTEDGTCLKHVSDINIEQYKVSDAACEICGGAFEHCRKLTTVEIPAAIKRISFNPFYDTSLKHLICHSPNYIVEDCFLLSKNRELLVSYFGNESKVAIPHTVRVIGEKAFACSKSLVSVDIPYSVEIIDDNAFEFCQLLKHIDIPSSVKSIGSGAFLGCPFEEIILPPSLHRIGNSVFSYCNSLSHIELPCSITVLESSMFEECVNLKSVTIPDSVEVIKEEAFKGCEQLSEIVMPGKLNAIEGNAFEGCTSLESIELPESLSRITFNPFAGSGIKNIVCRSEKFVVENTTLYTSDGKVLIVHWGNDENFTIPESVISICDEAFKECHNIRNIKLPSELRELGNEVFMECTSLQSISIPQLITSLPSSSFYGCSSLRSIELPESMTEIGSAAFCECESLKSIEIPSSVTAVCDFAFIGCSHLSKIVIRSEEMKLGDELFDNCPSMSQIIVPHGRSQYYVQRFNESLNNEFAEYITEG